MSETCPSCGKEWIYHLGIQYVCAENQQLKSQLAAAEKVIECARIPVSFYQLMIPSNYLDKDRYASFVKALEAYDAAKRRD